MDNQLTVAALLSEMTKYESKLAAKKKISNAEKRHLLKIRAVLAIRAGKKIG